MSRLPAALLICLSLMSAPALAQPYPAAQPAPGVTPGEAPQTTSPDADPDEASPQAAPPGDTPDAAPAGVPAGAPAGAPASAYQPPAPAPTLSLEGRIRASAAAAEGLQGPMEGGWTARTDDGVALYGFQLVDPPNGVLEGAWRDLRRTGAMEARGVIASVVRNGGELTVRFYPRDGGAAATLDLTGYSDDVWGGTLTAPNGAKSDITVTRNVARPVVDYAAGGWTTRPVGAPVARPRPARVEREYERPRRDRHGRIIRERSHERAEHGRGARGKAAKASKGGHAKAAPAKKKKKR